MGKYSIPTPLGDGTSLIHQAEYPSPPFPQNPWRDFSEEEQRAMRQLLRLAKDHPGKRFEVVMLRQGDLEIWEVQRRKLTGPGVNR